MAPQVLLLGLEVAHLVPVAVVFGVLRLRGDFNARLNRHVKDFFEGSNMLCELLFSQLVDRWECTPHDLEDVLGRQPVVMRKASCWVLWQQRGKLLLSC